ncbi:MAG: TonB-dependent receptor [Chitinophagaceae bacterium]|nr:TonB-dependent receptor [Chitinophagaceae bacterium]MBP6415721.1 TonB-dependent receptor [Chitinophagaceae bacterium]
MRKILTLLALTLTVLSVASNAQVSNGSISGTVIDGSTKTIESATITLLRVKDSSVVKMSVADKTGKYVFEAVPEGKYFVSISAVGHTKGFSETFDVTATNPSVLVKTIELVPKPKAMGEVTVMAKKPLIEQKIDRTIVNVDASVTNVGNSALEVLEKSPGITVDKDGNISLKGKQGIMVMIDGRPSYLSGADLASMLRSMPASQLDQIEIMTNPPAKYDAAGNSGIINIKTKKNKQFGYNGSITSTFTQGRFARFSEGVNFNYRNGKINLFTNLNYNRNHRGEDLDIVRNMREANSKEILSIFDQQTRMVNQGHYYSGKIGLDYAATKKTTLGIVLNGFYNPSFWESKTKTFINEPDGQLRSQTNTLTSQKEKWTNFSSNVNLRHVFDSTGQELTSDFDYVQYKSTSIQPLYSSYFDRFGNPAQASDTLLGSLPQNIKIISGKIDYIKPLKDGAKFEAGFKASHVKTDNNAVYENWINNSAILDSSRSNHFIYNENITAAYVNYSRKLGKKWSSQLGLRLESTQANGDSKGYTFNSTHNKFLPFNEKFKRDYTQLFPTIYLQYTANEKNSFVINYGRRINRPNYQDLNPFINFLDRYTFQQGNPNLKPQFSHNIELSHTYKGFLTTTLNYSNTTDIIQQVLEQNEITNETYVKKANIATRNQAGIAISAQKEIKKWWSGNIYTNVSYNQFKGVVNNENISIGLTMLMVQVQQQFKWGKGWGAELSGFYRSNAVEGVIFIQQMAQVSAGFSKQILKNKGSIRLNVRDIFAGNVAKGYSKYGNVDAKFTNVNDSRAVTMSFTYRFNKGKLKAGSNRKNNGASDEQQRVNTGN